MATHDAYEPAARDAPKVAFLQAGDALEEIIEPELPIIDVRANPQGLPARAEHPRAPCPALPGASAG